MHAFALMFFCCISFFLCDIKVFIYQTDKKTYQVAKKSTTTNLFGGQLDSSSLKWTSEVISMTLLSAIAVYIFKRIFNLKMKLRKFLCQFWWCIINFLNVNESGFDSCLNNVYISNTIYIIGKLDTYPRVVSFSSAKILVFFLM